jgi:hypothetical protein
VVGLQYGDKQLIAKAGDRWHTWVEAYKHDFVMRELTDLKIQLIGNDPLSSDIQQWLLLRQHDGGESKISASIAGELIAFVNSHLSTLPLPTVPDVMHDQEAQVDVSQDDWDEEDDIWEDD